MQRPADGSAAFRVPPEAGDAQKWWALLSVAFGAFMAPLDSSIVNTVLPIIAHDFGADILLIEWVVLAYLLTLSSLLLIGGRLGDLLGDRRLYVSGFSLFTLSSAFCGASAGVPTLIAARVLQAIGGAMLIAIGPAILTRAFPASQRGQALGIQASVVYIGLAVGPGLGGLIASTLGWRSVFFINLPIGVVAMAVALSVLRRGGGRRASGPFDFTGAAAYMVTLFAFVLALSRGTAWGWGSLVVASAGAVSIAAAATFLRVELSSPHPFLDLSLFRHRLFAAATLSALLNYMAANTTAFLTPFLLIRGHGMTPARAGSLLMAMPIVMAAVAPASGWLSDRIGSRIPTGAGMTCLAAGMWRLAHLGPGADDRQILLCLGLAGLGVGLFTSPNNSAIMGAVPQTSQGLASGLVATARTMGMILGVAVSGSLFGAEAQQLLPVLGQEPMAVIGAFRHAVSIGAGIALAGALTSLIRGKSART